jgi:8-oxo-dGTP diphosphatase
MPPGGEVQFGESLANALRREVKEETGLYIEPKRLVWIHEFIEKPYHAVEFYFECEVTGGKLKLGQDPEYGEADQILLDLKFFRISELSSAPVYPEFLRHHFAENNDLPKYPVHVENESDHALHIT